MTNTDSKVTIHMVASLDGFISKADGDVSWMHSTDRYEPGIELSEADIDAFVKAIDCYIMGSRTYEQALKLGWPYGDTPVIVLTSRDLKSERENVHFYHGDLQLLLEEQVRPNYQNTWMVGGATTTKSFLRSQLADEIVLSMMPILLGEGLLFFDYIGREQPLHLKEVTAYKDGMVELCYAIKKV